MSRPSRRARSNSRSGSVSLTDEGAVRQSSRLKGGDRSSRSDRNERIEKASKHMVATPALKVLSNAGPMVRPSSLEAILPQGKSVKVKIKFNGSRLRRSETPIRQCSEAKKSSRAEKTTTIKHHNGETFVQTTLGDDGNLYYCNNCNEVGDVVCCDGCPRVYHPTCVPLETKSRKSLDADDDPWFCPTCMNETDSDCKGDPNKEQPRDFNDRLNGVTKTVVNHEEKQRKIDAVVAKVKPKSKSIQSKSINGSTNGYTSESSSEVTPTPLPPPPPPSLKTNGNTHSPKKHEQSILAPGKSRSRELTNHNDESINRPSKKRRKDKEEPPYTSSTIQKIPPMKRSLPEKATSPFFFFLLENRIKLERQLTRRNRAFKRVKGYQRNLMLAKEGALLWAKTTKLERKKYLDMAIQEFEYNVLTWKEDETLREMMIAEGNQDQDDPSLDSEGHISDADVAPRDSMYWDKKFQDLVAPSQVGCRRIRSNAESIQNGVLLELLQDSRFHSLPMMKANRDCEIPDYSTTAVPHFNVQGPLATSIGDGCLGCIRGWNHYCPILKRHFPAVEHRAKLQPPCPSHLPTRIGIGLPQSNDEEQKYSYSDKKTYKDLRFLSKPTTRGDEIIKLVETAMAVKLPVSKDTTQEQHSKKRKKSKKTIPGQELYECGRCKTGTTSNMGCVTCRRVKLLVDLSKKPPGDKDKLSIQTVMLGRTNTKSDEFHKQTEGEKKISKGLIKRHWKPNAIMPPMKKVIPPKYPPHCDEESISDDEVSSSSISSTETDEKMSSNEMEDSETIQKMATSDESKSSSDEATQRKRRMTRSSVTKTNEESSKYESNRQAMAEVHKEEADSINARCLSIATCGILLAMIRRDPLRLFAEPVPANVEGYHKIIKKPMDLSTMKEKVLNKQYSSLGAFVGDAKLLCINSLIYNPPGTIYSMTAEEIRRVLDKMQRRALKWMSAIKNSHASYYARYQTQNSSRKRSSSLRENDIGTDENDSIDIDPFQELRKTWPGAVELFEDDGKWLRSQVEAEFVRTKENEFAYYSALAVRRAARAAEAALAPIFESDSVFSPCIRRSHNDDETLRSYVNKAVAESSDPSQITIPPSWREQDVLEFLKKVQKRRVETKISPEDGCARCDKISIDDEANKLARETSVIRRRKKNDGVQVRIAESRRNQSNGMASKRERDRVLLSQNESLKSLEAKNTTARDKSVTVRGSNIQGWGLFADTPFKKGELVAEYVGEYVVNPMADKREKFYEERRIQDYQFRVSATLVIDATKLGGHARYINHSCDPSCVAKIIDGDPPNKHLKRVIVISQRDIQAGEEITYDYQFPLELDLDARIPCNCGSKTCRGFMNWDLPESGSLVSRASTRQGRRDRIRRLVNKAL